MSEYYAQLGGNGGRPMPWTIHVDADGRRWLVYAVTHNGRGSLSAQPIPVNYTVGLIFVDDLRQHPRRFAARPPTDRLTGTVDFAEYFARSEPFRTGREVVARELARGTPAFRWLAAREARVRARGL